MLQLGVISIVHHLDLGNEVSFHFCKALRVEVETAARFDVLDLVRDHFRLERLFLGAFLTVLHHHGLEVLVQAVAEILGVLKTDFFILDLLLELSVFLLQFFILLFDFAYLTSGVISGLLEFLSCLRLAMFAG